MYQIGDYPLLTHILSVIDMYLTFSCSEVPWTVGHVSDSPSPAEGGPPVEVSVHRVLHHYVHYVLCVHACEYIWMIVHVYICEVICMYVRAYISLCVRTLKIMCTLSLFASVLNLLMYASSHTHVGTL